MHHIYITKFGGATNSTPEPLFGERVRVAMDSLLLALSQSLKRLREGFTRYTSGSDVRDMDRHVRLQAPPGIRSYQRTSASSVLRSP